MVKINYELLPIKSHYFWFMAAMGPILPQLTVFGKEMGISPVIMGTITAILPITFLLAKPFFGLIVDIFRTYRKCVFLGIIIAMSASFAVLFLLPTRELHHFEDVRCEEIAVCHESNHTQIENHACSSAKLSCHNSYVNRTYEVRMVSSTASDRAFCYANQTVGMSNNCSNDLGNLTCIEDIELEIDCLYKTSVFWLFVTMLSIGCIAFNVANSISDAICFDVIGTKYDYGKQRVWGTLGFGITALISGYFVNWASTDAYSYTPAFLIMAFCTVVDLISCVKLKLPIMESPKNIFSDLCDMLQNRHTIVFITYAAFAGVFDGFIVYFLFWYIEDLAIATQTSDIKLIEGLIVAAETLGGEVIFFSIAGKILDRFGHAHSFSMCFINYALRLGLISVAPSPWYIIPIEFLMQGPTYALTYTTIVAYANAIAPPGASATMQGIAAGMDDGFGYAIGSLLGGLLYNTLGGVATLQILSAFALICSITHLLIYKCSLQNHHHPPFHPTATAYKTPGEVALSVYESSNGCNVNCI